MIEFNAHKKNQINIHYDIDLACNNRCEYCYKLDRLDNTKFINREVFDEVIKQINLLVDNHPEFKVNVYVVGGEPLLVVDEVIEFIDKVASEDVHVEIFSNLNFDKDSEQIQKIYEHSKVNKHFILMVTMHEYSNIEKVKQNILLCQDFTTVNFVLDDDNLERSYEKYKWLKENTNCDHCIEGIVIDNEDTFTRYDDPMYIEMFESSDDFKDDDIIGDKRYTYTESRQNDFLNISKQYYTICQLSQVNIDYDGNLSVICTYPYEGGHVSRGIKVKEVFCNKYECVCTTDAYKKLMRKR